MRKDRGEGEPVPLVPGGKKEAVASGRGVEVSLDHGDTEESDDLPEEEEHRGTNGDSDHKNYINTVVAISRFTLSCLSPIVNVMHTSLSSDSLEGEASFKKFVETQNKQTTS